MSHEHSDEAGAAAQDARQEPGQAEEARVAEALEQLRRLRVQDLALDMIVSLVTVGYQKLGLTDHTRQLRDLDEARLSIELLRACLDVLERERGAEALGDLRETLAAMQLSYARVAEDRSEAGAEAADGESPSEEAPAGERPGAG